MKNLKTYQLYQTLTEIPIYNWYNFAKSFDGIWFVKSGDGLPTVEEVEECYLKLQQEYIDTFGVDANTQMLMTYIKRKITLRADIINGNKFAKNQLKVAEAEMMAYIPTGVDSGGTLEGSMVAVSKFMGYRVDPKQTTVVEFHEMINLMQQYNGRETNKKK